MPRPIGHGKPCPYGGIVMLNCRSNIFVTITISIKFNSPNRDINDIPSTLSLNQGLHHGDEKSRDAIWSIPAAFETISSQTLLRLHSKIVEQDIGVCL